MLVTGAPFGQENGGVVVKPTLGLAVEAVADDAVDSFHRSPSQLLLVSRRGDAAPNEWGPSTPLGKSSLHTEVQKQTSHRS
ncbi:hypothetical protein ABZ656_16275 [Streptomyces sp. NPDC007095]|uniref:hypothetical protein n=1 Tax=Streptomyces sp. NPDC007095 TaxID=3154482 RepID=UPI0033E80F79